MDKRLQQIAENFDNMKIGVDGNKSRSDGKSLSRTAKLIVGNKDLLFIADSGPGEINAKGLIVPKFGSSPDGLSLYYTQAFLKAALFP